jgi:hypothetical protein
MESKMSRTMVFFRAVLGGIVPGALPETIDHTNPESLEHQVQLLVLKLLQDGKIGAYEDVYTDFLPMGHYG